MNPYQHLFDDPTRLNADEHTGECLSGGAVPWGQDAPDIPLTPKWAREGRTIRERLAALAEEGVAR